MSGLPVIIVDSGGWPVTISESDPGGMSMTVSDSSYGFPVTVVESGGFPVSGITVGPTIVITGTSVSEDAAVGTAVGTLSVTGGSGTYAYAMTGTAGGKFAMDGAAVETAAALDYETASSHVITVTANNGVDAIISRNITVIVTDVLEATLDPLENAVCISAADDDEPDFEFDLPVTAEAGWVIAAEYSVANADSWSSYFDHTLTAPEIVADIIAVYSVTSLAEGLWDFRFRLEDGSEFSAWETIEDVPVNFAPTISTLSPVDGATGVAADANLVITFNKNIQFGTGDINIYKTSDDSLFENFDVVTHAGTKLTIAGAVLTINPGSTYASLTDYYVQIDATAIQNTDEVAFAGIADETTYNFTSVVAVSEYELNVDTFYSSGTFTTASNIRGNVAKKVELWAAGGASLTNAGSGGGGAFSSSADVAVSPSTGYAVVVGVGATSASGTNSTFNSTTVVAEGGKAQGAGNSGGLAANGTGGTKWSGGNGTAATGTTNCGTAAGSEGNGNTGSTFGGIPDGGYAAAGGGVGPAWGCGARSSVAASGAGGKGHCRITYEVPRTAGYPYCVGRKGGRTPTATGTPHTVTYPTVEGGILAGDRIFLVISDNWGSSFTHTATGYSSFDTDTNSTNYKAEILTKVAAGGETGTFTLTSSSAAALSWLMLIYRGAGTPTSTSNNGSSTTATFVSHNAGSIAAYLWVAVSCCDNGTSNISPPTGASSGFTNIYIQPGTFNGGGHIQSCELRDNTVASKTPGTHALTATEQWCTFNIAIPLA